MQDWADVTLEMWRAGLDYQWVLEIMYQQREEPHHACAFLKVLRTVDAIK